jgi:predicted nucleic acid-binding protein
MILWDTNVFIDLFRGNGEVARHLEAIGPADIGLSAVTLMELLVGARDQKEATALKKSMEIFFVVPLDLAISALSMDSNSMIH